MTQIVERIGGVRENRRKYEVMVEWLRWGQTGSTREPVRVMVEDVPGPNENHLYNTGERNLKIKILYLYIKYEHVFASIFVRHCNESSEKGLNF